MGNYLTELAETLRALPMTELEDLRDTLWAVRDLSNRVYICGNGGSQAVAAHWGVDLLKVCKIDIHTLGTNQALHTAMANDLGYASGLSTELSMRARPGDITIALSCSGRSNNIVSVLGAAHKAHIPAYLITGHNAPVYPQVRTIRIDTLDYGILEDAFSAIGHWLAKELLT